MASIAFMFSILGEWREQQAGEIPAHEESMVCISAKKDEQEDRAWASIEVVASSKTKTANKVPLLDALHWMLLIQLCIWSSFIMNGAISWIDAQTKAATEVQSFHSHKGEKWQLNEEEKQEKGREEKNRKSKGSVKRIWAKTKKVFKRAFCLGTKVAEEEEGEQILPLPVDIASARTKSIMFCSQTTLFLEAIEEAVVPPLENFTVIFPWQQKEAPEPTIVPIESIAMLAEGTQQELPKDDEVPSKPSKSKVMAMRVLFEKPVETIHKTHSAPASRRISALVAKFEEAEAQTKKASSSAATCRVADLAAKFSTAAISPMKDSVAPKVGRLNSWSGAYKTMEHEPTVVKAIETKKDEKEVVAWALNCRNDLTAVFLSKAGERIGSTIKAPIEIPRMTLDERLAKLAHSSSEQEPKAFRPLPNRISEEAKAILSGISLYAFEKPCRD